MWMEDGVTKLQYIFERIYFNYIR